MKKIAYPLLLLLILPFGACKDRQESTGQLIPRGENYLVLNIDLDNLDSDGAIFAVDSLILIPLTDLPQARFGEGSKVLEAGQNYYVLDAEATQAVYVFDQRGGLRNRICHLGDGPGQYKELRDMAVDKTDGSFWVDAWPMKVIRYNAEGLFLEEIPRLIFSDGFARLTNGWAFSSHLNMHPKAALPFNLFVTNDRLELTGHYCPFNPKGLGISFGIKNTSRNRPMACSTTIHIQTPFIR